MVRGMEIEVHFCICISICSSTVWGEECPFFPELPLRLYKNIGGPHTPGSAESRQAVLSHWSVFSNFLSVQGCLDSCHKSWNQENLVALICSCFAKLFDCSTSFDFFIENLDQFVNFYQKPCWFLRGWNCFKSTDQFGEDWYPTNTDFLDKCTSYVFLSICLFQCLLATFCSFEFIGISHLLLDFSKMFPISMLI